jgi:hypothetical protein
MEGIRDLGLGFAVTSRARVPDDRMHTPDTSTETEAPEVAVAGDENDGQKMERSRGCQE